MAREPGSDLPAPYVNPWSLLRRDLGAVIASLGLSLRELWRRNREGSLPRPLFWPPALAALFWPMLVSLVLGLAVLATLRLQPAPKSPSAAPITPIRAPADQASTSGAAVPEAAPVPATGDADRQPRSPVPQESAPEQLNPEPPAAEEPSPSIARGLRLLGLLMRPETEDLLLGVSDEPERSRLILSLSTTVGALLGRRRQELADAWLDQARALGYEQLDLLDSAGESLGRSATVGSGMILFTAAPGA
ncbi:MAG: hypothetical protein ACKOCM_05245 [Cyanobacteriota bacterium]